MSQRSDLLNSIATATADYRVGEISPRGPEYIEAWINQFEKDDQNQILFETDHILKRTYFSKAQVQEFLRSLMKANKITGNDPISFWKRANLLSIQDAGASQKEMLALFDPLLQEVCKVSLKDCGQSADTFVYLDDGLFSGNRVRRDLTEWIAKKAPENATLHIVVMAVHANGVNYALPYLKKAATEAKKEIKFHCWKKISVEDRREFTNTSDVLRPARIPETDLAKAYAKSLTDAGYPPILRAGNEIGPMKFFSSSDGRDLVEQRFLISGLKIRASAPLLPENARPLGYSVLKMLGFGSLIVTFRNCPNNCPLVFWAGNPWMPLFERKTN